MYSYFLIFVYFFLWFSVVVFFFFFFKQKTAYEMRISDWSSDVCSSDLRLEHIGPVADRRWRVAQQHLDFSTPGVDMHWKQACAEAIIIAGPTAIVQLAYRSHFVAGISKNMMPRGRAAIVSVDVIPVACFIDVAARGKCGSGRHADRTGATGVGEARSLRREGIQIRRKHIGMPGAAQRFGVMFIRHDDQQVARRHMQ